LSVIFSATCRQTLAQKVRDRGAKHGRGDESKGVRMSTLPTPATTLPERELAMWTMWPNIYIWQELRH
jgi:hypothetical protein